jgi:putative membrane protein
MRYRFEIAALILALIPAVAFGQSNSTSSVTVSRGGLPNTPNSPTGGARTNGPEGGSEAKPAAPLNDLSSESDKGGTTDQDRRFVEQTQSIDGAQLDAARLAVNTSHDEKIKLFAQQLIDQDTGAQARLDALSKTAGISAHPSGQKARDEIAQLKAAKGTSFDAAYGQLSWNDTQAELALMKQEADSGGNKALKDYARLRAQALAPRMKNAEQLRTIALDQSNCPTSGGSKPGCS